MKVIYAILFERLHRYVFDNLYICYESGSRPFDLWDKIVLFIYHNGFKILPTWRKVLLKYFGKCNRYLRYYYSLTSYVKELNI